ncbi:Vsr endonuclease [Burkholderia phage vB_BceS_AH2]|uniref:Vsr endonuclease n=1 Tax=Burkholderia phage vB_BceS_AH2 TaxID=1133022 RepID=I6NSG0_9CAUD|nr:endonuclease [Burkholderia phage vB_BceS_AH2]AEY69542.1 Vsr endonuclease [Burkholderia phage vB_BceS_AH2]
MDRSAIMRAVHSENTSPEILIRKLIHSLGYRFRLHGRNLPGRPDLVFASRKKVIFVHGCFWHGHDCKRGARIPKTNVSYWKAKIARNRERDSSNNEQLRRDGWEVLVIWECETREVPKLTARLRRFLK